MSLSLGWNPVALRVALDVAPWCCGRGCAGCCAASWGVSASPQVTPTTKRGTPADIPSAAAAPCPNEKRRGWGRAWSARRLRGSGAAGVLCGASACGRRAGWGVGGVLPEAAPTLHPHTGNWAPEGLCCLSLVFRDLLFFTEYQSNAFVFKGIGDSLKNSPAKEHMTTCQLKPQLPHP